MFYLVHQYCVCILMYKIDNHFIVIRKQLLSVGIIFIQVAP